jgi:hypothetical protein
MGLAAKIWVKYFAFLCIDSMLYLNQLADAVKGTLTC